jgi:ADP-ribose pyrophosphatase YjhB (NUDIX family)
MAILKLPQPKMHVLNFCNQCGTPLRRQPVSGDNRERAICIRCGQVHYENPRVLVSCFAYFGNRLLMSRRALKPEYGRWAPPSGFVENGETLEDAAARETFEETGVTIAAELMLLYGVASLPHISEIYVTFHAKLTTEPEVIPGAESLEAAFQTESQIRWDQLAFRQILGDYPHRFFRHLRNGSFPIHQVQVNADENLHMKVHQVTPDADGPS